MTATFDDHQRYPITVPQWSRWVDRALDRLADAWAGYRAFRARRRAAAHLRSLSEFHLKDIGISRSQIEPAVRGDIDHITHVGRFT